MTFFTRLLGPLERVIDVTETPEVEHRDLLFEKNIRKVFQGFYPRMVNGRSTWIPNAICRVVGNTIQVRPSDVTRFIHDCKRYGIDTHPAAIELNSRFARDKGFYLEFANDEKTMDG